MNWKSLTRDAKWRLKHELFRRVLPRLEYAPFVIRRLSYHAWPRIAALTESYDYSQGIASIDWHSESAADDGSGILREHAEKCQPVVLRGYAKSTEVGSMSFEDLVADYGDTEVTARVGDYRSEFGQPQTQTMTLREYIDFCFGRSELPGDCAVVDGVGPYVGNQKIQALAEKVPCPDFFNRKNTDDSESSDRNLTRFWLGTNDSLTPLHCHHFCDTFVLQLVGRRSFTLIPPHQALFIGYMPHNLNIGMAAYDPYNPDVDQFPASQRIQSFEVDLGPGDALLLPGFWFHAARLDGPSISASQFIRSQMPAALGGGDPHEWSKTDPFERGF